MLVYSVENFQNQWTKLRPDQKKTENGCQQGNNVCIGIIKLPILGGSNQCKSIVSLRDWPLMLHSLSWCHIMTFDAPTLQVFWGSFPPSKWPDLSGSMMIFETLRPRKLDSWYPKARRSQSEGPTVGPGAIMMVWIDMGESQNWWILRNPSFETHSHLWCYQIFFDLKPYYWRHALRIIQTNTTQR